MSKLMTVTFKVEVPNGLEDMEESFVETTMDGMVAILEKAGVLFNFGVGSIGFDDMDDMDDAQKCANRENDPHNRNVEMLSEDQEVD